MAEHPVRSFTLYLASPTRHEAEKQPPESFRVAVPKSYKDRL
jgi:hypothetical protein